MKRSISSSVLRKKSSETADAPPKDVVSEPTQDARTISPAPSTGLKPRMGGSGSAWKAGALSDTQVLLNEKRAQIVGHILQGKHELELDPTQIKDEIGTDRRDDWIDQDAFNSLLESIEQNGQDTPIQIWPVDPNWQPDPLDPENCAGVPFFLITGRRRHAIAQKLGRPVRAILASPEKRGVSDDQFEMLFMRFRENEERENLGAFERLLSVGQMFDRYEASNPDKKVTAVSFASIIGVHESHVSRGKAVFKARDEILHACKNVYALSHRELEKVVSDLIKGPVKTAKGTAKTKKLTIIRKFGREKLSVSSQGGKLSVSAAGIDLDKHSLEGLGDMIAAYLQEHGSKK
ncbi:replication protein [Ascidiaceihabitans sp.]|uniref:replication protein n=1 Tax=Ascidiaceihabitans sp. TaxID=1872644 RepID=UPI00329A1BFC